MSTLQMALLAVLVVLALAWLGLRAGRAKPANRPKGDRPAERLDTIIGWPPQATRLLSGPEREAFGMLVRAFPDHIVLAQVPIARFVTVPKRNSYADWLRRVGYQCVDLLVCDPATQVVAVIELQAAQPSEQARKRLLRMARTLKAAEVPLHVWRDNALPAFATIRTTVLPDAPPAATAAVTAPEPFGEPVADETIELLEPPPSTWYDDLDSQKAPLGKPWESGR